MSIIKYCGITFLALSVIMVLSEFKPKLARLLSILTGIYFFTSVISLLYPTVGMITKLIDTTGFKDYFSTLLKALGVALAVEICADTCIDAGEASLARKIEMVGKAELLLLALPLVYKLIELARGLVL